jgi:tetratricopeptide (TPR) repeat protein
MIIPVRFRYSDIAARPAAAWLVEGTSAAEWLVELVAAELPLAAAKLRLVPTSSLDLTPCGVLVTDVSPPAHGVQAALKSPRIHAYGLVHRRLYLPIEATWEPNVGGAEIEALLEALLDDDASTYVWHPRAGLLRFGPTGVLRVSDLLAAPPPRAERWDLAVPGIALSTKLTSLEPEFTLTAQQVLEEGRGDIGTQRPDAALMPPSPNEAASGPMAGLGRAVERGLAGGLLWLAQKLPQGAGGAGGPERKDSWLNSLEEWAASKLRRISESLEAARNRELHRLMNLLQNDPDEGLKFALPMGGGENRGVAPPSSTLGPRNVDFRLGNLGGGGPTDTWDMPWEMQRKLVERYRELAAREIQLGRHRRAAYIFAELLNDVQTAANTLEDGRHYREAAAIYEDKLKRPLEAARCLRRGGLRTEAIAIFERLEEHETVGDLYAELERTDEANAAWRRAVAVKLKVDDVLGAAVLLERKLNDVDEAYARLTAAWPHTKQASLCLTTAFGLLARHERHDQAAALVAELPELRTTSWSPPTLVEVLGAQALEYPSDAVRLRAADQVRIVASQRLTSPTVDNEEAARLARVVGGLVPRDKLLARDGQRFLDRRRKTTVPSAAPVARTDAIQLVRELKLPSDIEWETAAATDEAIYATGFRGRELVVMRTDWNGGEVDEATGPKWTVERVDSERWIALSVDSFADDQVVVHVCGAEPLTTTRFFKRSDLFIMSVGVGSHRGLSRGSYGMCISDRGMLYIAQDGGESLLIYLHAQEKKSLTGFVALDLLGLPGGLEDCRLPLPMFANDKGVYVGIGTNLCRIRSGTKAEIIQTLSPITQLVGSAKGSRPRLAVAMETGGLMLWDDELHGALGTFASEMHEPRITLTRDGALVAAGGSEIETYSTHDRKLKLTSRTTATALKTPRIAALAMRQTNRFAILSGDGMLRYYQLKS